MMKTMNGLLYKYSHWVLGISVLIGTGLRWLQIGRYSFWYDETFSTLTAQLNLSQILSNAALGVHPPGYYLLLHYWIMLGQSEAFIRALSALFGIGAILLIYGFGKWLFDRSVAALASLGLAIFPFQVYFSQEARMYSLVIFLSIAIMWVFLYGVTTKGTWLVWGGYALLAALGLYIYYFVIFLLLALSLWFLWRISKYKKSIIRFLLANGLIILLFLPQLNQALARTSTYLGTEAWQKTPHISSLFITIYYLLFAHRVPIWLVPITLFLAIISLVLILWDRRHRPDTKDQFELALWLSLLVPIVTVMIISWISPRSIYIERSFAFCTPALILLLARGAVVAPRWSPTPYLVGALIFPIVITYFNSITTLDPVKPPVREASLTIQANFLPNDVSLHLQDASALPALWYVRGIPQLLVDAPGAAFTFDTTHQLFGGDIVNWRFALEDADRLWLMVVPGEVGPEQEEIYEEIDNTYPQLKAYDWGAVQLYLYDVQNVR